MSSSINLFEDRIKIIRFDQNNNENNFSYLKRLFSLKRTFSLTLGRRGRFSRFYWSIEKTVRVHWLPNCDDSYKNHLSKNSPKIFDRNRGKLLD